MKSIEILDMNGKTVYSSQEVNKLSVTFDSGFIPKGNYLVCIRTDSGQKGIRKIVVL
jgi:hypothetical protein